jgi:HSP20 family protein
MANTSIEIKRPAAPAAGSQPVDAWHAMRHEMERLFDRFSSFDLPSFARLSDIEHFWPRSGGNGALLSVSVDVAEDDKGYTITAELPGLDESDIDVSVTDDVLTLKGEKRAETEEKNKNRYVCERSYGAFQRSFALPADADADKIDAKFAKGVLTIALPKNPKAQPSSKKIDVKAA